MTFLQKIIFPGIFGLMIITLPFSIMGQMKAHQINNIWVTRWETETRSRGDDVYHLFTYPAGDFIGESKNYNCRGRSMWIGARDFVDYADPNVDSVYYSAFINQNGLGSADPGFTKPLSNKKYVRNAAPNIMVNMKKEQHPHDHQFGSIEKKDLIADEMIETIYATRIGIQVTKRSYAFANQNHANYIIQSYTFKNNGNFDDDTTNTPEQGMQDLKDVYFGFIYNPCPSRRVGYYVIRDYTHYAHYYGTENGDSLRIGYAYDGDAAGVRSDGYNQGSLWDDRGKPDVQRDSQTGDFSGPGEFLSPMYIGFGLIHADKAYNDRSNDLNQPATVVCKAEDELERNDWTSDVAIYDYLNSHEKIIGTDLGLFSGPDDKLAREGYITFAIGPYNIPFGEKVHIILYDAAGSINQRLARSEGAKWVKGTLEFKGLTGDEAKNALIDTGKDSLFKAGSTAQWAWKNGLQNVPVPPRSPSINITPGIGQNIINWEDVSNEPGLVGYRIYRTKDDYTNLYELIYDTKDAPDALTTQYIDTDVELMNNYFYYVTAYNDGSSNTTGLYPGQSLESSHYLNRHMNPVKPGIKTQSSMDSIYVVPNPYHYRGLAFGGAADLYRYQSENDEWELKDQISFVGLPTRAIIRIFTIHGDLVAEINHPDPAKSYSVYGAGDEAWFQITKSHQLIKAGVYFYIVEGWDANNKFLGVAKGKFVVVR